MVITDVMQRVTRRRATARGGNRPGTSRPAAGARAALLALLSVAALSPPPARAQVHITSSGLIGNSATLLGGRVNVGAGGDATLHGAQPFTTPDVTGAVSINQVVLYFSGISGAINISDNDFAVVAIHESRTNPVCVSDSAGMDCRFAPVIPSAQGSDPNDFFGAGNVPANFLFRFDKPDRITNGRNVFNAPATGITLQPNTTYHLYVSMGNVSDFTLDSLPGEFERTGGLGLNVLNVGECSSGTYNMDNDNYLDVVENSASAWSLGLAVTSIISSGFEAASDLYSFHTGKTLLVDIIGEPNHAPTGLSITGELGLGETLTADTSDIADANGLTGVSYGYQWTRAELDGTGEQDIAGETSETYVLADADQDKRIGAAVDFIDDHCYENSRRATRDFSRAPDAPPEGEPTIDGDAVVGETLEANTDGITDGNGLVGVTFEYQWSREDADGSNSEDIAGAVGETYALVDDDANKRIRVRVTFTDNEGYEAGLPSEPTAVVNALPTGLPAVDGTARVGATLTANTDEIMDANGLVGMMFEYQWSRENEDGSSPEDISGAASATYMLVEADSNKRVRVRVRVTDDDDNDAVELTSAATDVVDGLAMGRPTIRGAASVGEMLEALTDGIMDANGLVGVTFAYQWLRADADGTSNLEEISGATGSTYNLVAADGNRRIRVRVTFTDNGGYEAELTSEPTSVVNAAATGLRVTGDYQVGETLTADTDRITDGNGLPANPVFTYQWRRATTAAGAGATDIRGATGSSYVNVEADQGNWVRARVRFQDAADNAEVLESAWTEVRPEANIAATGLQITGTAQVGATLAADTAGITDGNGLPPAPAYVYQWSRVDADGSSNPMDVSGATSRTYVLTDDDLDKRMRVRVRFQDADGNDENLLSAAGEVVAAADSMIEATVEKSLLLFGRAVAMQMLDATRLRLDAQCAPGSQLTVAGHGVGGWDADQAEEGAWQALRRLSRFNGMSGRDALAGSSFSLARDGVGNGCVSVWGRGSYSSYADKERGVAVDGSVATGQVGADWSSGAWMIGLSVAHSMGDSDYQVEDGEGDIDMDLTGVYPYTRYRFTERFSSWAAGGLGMGDVEYMPRGQDALKTDIDLLMGAAGFRGELLTADADGGFAVALKADAFYVQMEADEVDDQLGAISADTRRLRLGLEGSRLTELQDGAMVTPSLELGLLHDRGGLSTGSGMDLGIGFTYEHPGHGFWVDFRGRSLLTHEAGSLQEWGVSGELRYDLDLSSERGLALSLNSGYGARSSGGAEALFNLREFDDLAVSKRLPGGRLDAEIGYGLGVFGGRFVSKPWVGLGMTETGSEWRLGWLLAPAGQSPLRLGVELNQRNSEQAVMLNLGAGL